MHERLTGGRFSLYARGLLNEIIATRKMNLKWFRQFQWEQAAHIATIIAVVVAAVAYYDGAISNRRSADAQREVVAISVLQDYMKLAIDHRDVADRPHNLPANDEYEWFAAYAYFSAESIHNLTHGRPTWDSTVASIVRYYRPFVRDGHFPCKDYSPRFVAVVKRELSEVFKCYPPGSEPR